MTIGAESVIYPGVRIYPYKEVESGAQIHSSLIWESRARHARLRPDGVQGLINVDLTPEMALRLGAALGTALKRGARVVASREAPAACRMLKRAFITGVLSTGVDVADLRVLPVGREPPPPEVGELRRGRPHRRQRRPTPRSSRSSSTSGPASS